MSKGGGILLHGSHHKKRPAREWAEQVVLSIVYAAVFYTACGEVPLFRIESDKYIDWFKYPRFSLRKYEYE